MTLERIDPLDLLDCARLLAGAEDSAAPTTARLRRATSSAYYAVFHQITLHGARWMSHHDDVVEENTVSRWFSHTSIDRAARLVVKMASDPIAGGQSGARQLFPSLGGSPLLIVAASFSSLQGRRHLADYAHDVDATRSATLADVDRAADAVDQAVEMWESADRAHHNFLLLSFALPVVRSR